MKHKKTLVVAAGISVLLGGTALAVEPFIPRYQERPVVANVEAVESEETMPKPEEQPVGAEVTNPAPLPASEPVIQPAPAPVPPAAPSPVDSETLARMVMPLIQRANTANGGRLTNESIYEYIRRTHEANPAPFVPNALQSIVDTCTKHLSDKYAEYAGRSNVDFIRYRSTTVCPL